jgi:hypothetical protein
MSWNPSARAGPASANASAHTARAETTLSGFLMLDLLKLDEYPKSELKAN